MHCAMTAKGAREFRRRRRMIGIASAIDRCCMVRDQKGEKCVACEKLKVAPNFKHEKKSKKPRRLSPPSPFQLDPSPCSLPLSFVCPRAHANGPPPFPLFPQSAVYSYNIESCPRETDLRHASQTTTRKSRARSRQNAFQVNLGQ